MTEEEGDDPVEEDLPEDEEEPEEEEEEDTGEEEGDEGAEDEALECLAVLKPGARVRDADLSEEDGVLGFDYLEVLR